MTFQSQLCMHVCAMMGSRQVRDFHNGASVSPNEAFQVVGNSRVLIYHVAPAPLGEKKLILKNAYLCK